MSPHRPLPDGWIEQHDPNYNHPFWVDTWADPPRAIWVHPYEDERFLREHPELRSRNESDLDAPPSYDVATGGHTSGDRGRDKAGPPERAASPDDTPGPSAQTEHRRGVFARLKDKAIGTKEEREEHKRIRAEQAAQAEERARQARMRQLEEREAYMRAYGGYGPYQPSYPARPGYDPAQRSGLAMDNPAAFLLGGIAGGLLLGDILSGGI